MPRHKEPPLPTRPILPTLLVTALLLGPAPVVAQQAGRPGQLEHLADSLLAPFNQPGAPGASLLILQGDSVLLRKSYGLANLETGEQATPATDYRLASLTKQFTAAAVLLLVQDGKVGLDDSIRAWFPGLPPATGPITVRNLLNHSSGLLDYEDLLRPDLEIPVRDPDVYALIAGRDSVLFPAGTRFLYSNTGYTMLALLVERASGERFPDFLRRRIFQPLGMHGSVAYEPGISTVPHRAFGYSTDSTGHWIRTDQSLTSAVLGDGGIYTSISDLERWYRGLDAGRVLGPAMLQQAYTAPGIPGADSAYGFGWFLDPFEGRPSRHHTGSTIGFRNAVRRMPQEGITVVLLTNRNNAVPIGIVDQVVRYLLSHQ